MMNRIGVNRFIAVSMLMSALCGRLVAGSAGGLIKGHFSSLCHAVKCTHRMEDDVDLNFSQPVGKTPAEKADDLLRGAQERLRTFRDEHSNIPHGDIRFNILTHIVLEIDRAREILRGENS
jgi:hypothetical protein